MAVCDLTLKKIKRDIKRLDRKIKAAGRGSLLEPSLAGKIEAKRATIGFWLLALVAFLGFLFANHQDFQDELLEQQQYCLDVEDGYMPDHKNIYNEMCK